MKSSGVAEGVGVGLRPGGIPEERPSPAHVQDADDAKFFILSRLACLWLRAAVQRPYQPPKQSQVDLRETERPRATGVFDHANHGRGLGSTSADRIRAVCPVTCWGTIIIEQARDICLWSSRLSERFRRQGTRGGSDRRITTRVLHVSSPIAGHIIRRVLLGW